MNYECYVYEGPVLMFDKVVASRWSAQTYATSEKKAKSNLIYQYKKQHGLVPSARIVLAGEIQLVK